MTDLLDAAMLAGQSLSPAAQDEIARLVLTLSGGEQAPVQLTPEEEASFGESLAQAARNEFARDEQVRAVWALLAH